MFNCLNCESTRIHKAGYVNNGHGSSNYSKQRWICLDCRKGFHTEVLVFKKKVSILKRVHQKYFDQRIFNIGYVDIETDGQLKGDFGNILTATILIRNLKTEKTRIYKFKVTKKEILTKYNYDRRIVRVLFEKIQECDLLIGHYFNGWKKFDMPFLRTRCEMMKIKIPTYKMLKYGDTWNIAHAVLSLQSYSLGGVARGLGLKDIKTRFDEKTWKLARRGNLKCINKVLDHNVKDVILTYRVHKKLEKYVNISSNYF